MSPILFGLVADNLIPFGVPSTPFFNIIFKVGLHVHLNFEVVCLPSHHRTIPNLLRSSIIGSYRVMAYAFLVSATVTKVD